MAMVRAQITNLSTGEIMGDDGTNYDYTVFAPTANAVAESMPEEVEYASCVLPEREYNIYYEEKLLSDVDYIYVDSCFFQVFGIPLLKGNLKKQGYISEVKSVISEFTQYGIQRCTGKYDADPRFCGIYL